jgi:HSP20 family protein
MSLIRWNPARELGSFPSDVLNMQREINRMFDSFFRSEIPEGTPLAASVWTPAVDIAEDDNGYVVKVELPGVNREQVKITMQDNVLSIRGEKKAEKESRGSSYHRVERSYGAFERCFSLPSNVKSDTIDATFKDGILTVSLPKAEESKPKQIEVTVK